MPSLGPQALRTKDVSTGHDNLYVASIVAVHVDTGELKWHYQMVPGDEWDYDSVQQMILADLNINGKTRKVIMQANKNGFFYVLDRVTGEFISAQPFSRVTWAKGIDQKTGRPIINTEVKYGKDPVPVSPGGGGAHNWSPMSYNPQTGLVYIPTRGWDTFTYATDFDFKPDPSRAGGAGQTGLKLNTRGLTTQPAGPATGPAPLEGGNLGTLVAYDPVKQEIRWRVPVGNSRYGGTLSTASNLVFQVAPNGHLIAYSADKGEALLDTATGLRNGMGPPITFEVDGQAVHRADGRLGRHGESRPERRGDHADEAAVAGIRSRRQGGAAPSGRTRACCGGPTPAVGGGTVNPRRRFQALVTIAVVILGTPLASTHLAAQWMKVSHRGSAAKGRWQGGHVGPRASDGGWQARFFRNLDDGRTQSPNDGLVESQAGARSQGTAESQRRSRVLATPPVSRPRAKWRISVSIFREGCRINLGLCQSSRSAPTTWRKTTLTSDACRITFFARTGCRIC